MPWQDMFKRVSTSRAAAISEESSQELNQNRGVLYSASRTSKFRLWSAPARSRPNLTVPDHDGNYAMLPQNTREHKFIGLSDRDDALVRGCAVLIACRVSPSQKAMQHCFQHVWGGEFQDQEC